MDEKMKKRPGKFKTWFAGTSDTNLLLTITIVVFFLISLNSQNKQIIHLVFGYISAFKGIWHTYLQFTTKTHNILLHIKLLNFFVGSRQ